MEAVAQAARFAANVGPADGRGCTPWIGYVDPEWGYGKWAVRDRPDRSRLAHRSAWALAHGPIPDGLCVLHRCDNPPCVNVAHLFLGTNLDNIHDRDRKGRQRALSGELHWTRHHPPEARARGERVGTAKLTERIVARIRTALANGAAQSALGLAFGVSRQSIGRIASGRTWTHVGP